MFVVLSFFGGGLFCFLLFVKTKKNNLLIAKL